jgi:hypothetical protein
MPGRKITNHQIRLYMKFKQMGKTQIVASAQAGFSERSAQRIDTYEFRAIEKKRNWKTRSDPFELVWKTELIPLLEAEPKLEARTLLEELQRRHEGEYPNRLLRTLQRRVRQWKATFGPEKEIIFRQKHVPGWQGISDFTDASELGITIRGELLPHLLYHYRLSYSGWEYAQVVLGGESYTALAEGLQNAFWCSGGVPQTHRTDSLSAAYRNCSDKAKEEFTDSYRELCEYYNVDPTRNNKGVSHENGSIESPHRHLKHHIDQALMLRRSKDFDSIDMYRSFIREIIVRQNKRIEKRFAEERAFLKALPERKTSDYSEDRVKVTSSSTILLKDVTYSVPSRLIGMTLKVHIYDDRLECYVGGDHVITLQRLRRNKKRLHHIDYRHIVGSLMRKPQAFRSYIYKDDLFPTFAFRQTWELMDKQLDSRVACREFIKILNEAARPGGQEKVNDYLEGCLARGVVPTSYEAKALFKNCEILPPELKMNRAEPSDYDSLLRNMKGGIL